MYVRSSLLFLALSLPCYAEVATRYLGTLHNQHTQMEQLAKLDLIPHRSEGNLTYIAFLTLYFGDFSSHEYITYHYDGATFDVESSTLSLDQPDQALTFVTVKKGDAPLEGPLISSAEGVIGVLSLHKNWQDPVVPAAPLSPALFNEYRGICRGSPTTLQIQTMRSADDTIRIGNPFGAYTIKAQYGEALTSEGCFGSPGPCAKYLYDFGSYNYFRGELNLFGRVNNLGCTVKSKEITCNGCSFIPATTSRVHRYRLPYSPAYWEEPGFVAAAPSSVQPETVAGTYRGLLHHEYLDTYQDLSLTVTSIPKDEDGHHTFALSSTARIYFGGFASSESLYYKFKQSEYQIFGSTFLLQNIAADTDAIIQIEEISQDQIKGSWYSILFGRVGSFIVCKSSCAPPSRQINKMTALGGVYLSKKWVIDLSLARENTPIATQNPFFPLNFRGNTALKKVPDFNSIIGGSYDFYTGKIGLQIEDGSFFFGERPPAGNSLQLKRATPGILRPLQPQALVVYEKGAGK
jgi:hypothetical protein